MTRDCHLSVSWVFSVTCQVVGNRGLANVLLFGEWKGAPGLCGHGELVVCVHISACVLDLLTLFGCGWLPRAV